MRVSLGALLASALLAFTVSGSFWSDILNGLRKTHRFDQLFDVLENSTDLLSDDDASAVFICEIVNGDVPDALADIPTVVEEEVEDEFAALTSFVGGLPSLVPELFSEIVTGGEVVVSIIEEIFTAPGEALTVIENGVESVWSDITAGVASVVGDITHFIGCDIFGDCPSFTDNGILSRCSDVLDSYSATLYQPSATPTSSVSYDVWWTTTATPGGYLTTVPTQTFDEPATTTVTQTMWDYTPTSSSQFEPSSETSSSETFSSEVFSSETPSSATPSSEASTTAQLPPSNSVRNTDGLGLCAAIVGFAIFALL